MAPTKSRFCPHCEESVSVRTYREHFDLSLTKEKDEWQKIESSDEEDSLVQAEVRFDLLDEVQKWQWTNMKNVTKIYTVKQTNIRYQCQGSMLEHSCPVLMCLSLQAASTFCFLLLARESSLYAGSKQETNCFITSFPWNASRQW